MNDLSTKDSTNTKDLALHLSRDLGMRVFPCYPRGHERAKAPMTEHGQKDASNLEGVILKWFGGPVPKLIGLPCKDNGFFAVDIDTPQAAATWNDWITANGMAEPCPWQKTAKGAHYLFKYPSFNFSGAVGKLAPGIDLRADNYICTGGDGSGYEWQTPIDQGLPEAPQWLLNKIKNIAAITTTERTAPATNPPLNPDLTAAYWLKYYAKKATLGTRNECTYKLGLQLFYAGIPLEDALNLYQDWVAQIPYDPSNHFSSFEYNRTIKSAYSGERKEATLLPAEAVIGTKKNGGGDIIGNAQMGETDKYFSPPEQGEPAKNEPKPEATKPPEPKKQPKNDDSIKIGINTNVEEETDKKESIFSTWADLDTVLGPIEWDWPGWLAKGFLHILVGMTGEGKSRLALRVCGTYLNGCEWPDGLPYNGGAACVLWCEAEAGQAMNRDRAKAMGYPTERIYSPLGDPLGDFRLNEPAHLAKLAYMAMLPEVKLIVVDSLSGADPTAEKSTEDAKNVNWLAGLARDTQKPILLTHHLRKRGLFDTEGEVSLDRVRGISTILQYARVIWAIDTPNLQDKETKRLSVIKSNLAKKPEPIGFVINDEITFTDAPEKPKVETLQDRGVDLLLTLLSKGAMPAKTIEEEFDGAGLSKRTLWEAKKALAIVSTKQPQKGWLWSLPATLGDDNDY